MHKYNKIKETTFLLKQKYVLQIFFFFFELILFNAQDLINNN